jgi:2-polyprenyl-6-methoxyphenol hydroxylase-like FAD-dependent oxidoreductase
MRDVDVAVVGGGPVGCVAALAHARKGLKVALLEAAGDGQERFAGELLHPGAVRAMEAVGVKAAEVIPGAREGGGFAVFAPELDAPVTLSYAQGSGLTARFHSLVEGLREEAAGVLSIRYMPRCKVTGIEGQDVHFERASGGSGTLRAARIIGADGRFSAARRALGLESERTVLSHMAGLTLRGVTLPFEGRGQVVLGGPGPALAYRIDDDHVRVCLDVPTPWRKHGQRERLLWDAYGPVLPAALAGPIRRALEAGEVQWAINAVQPRTTHGRDGLCLVGDSVGYFHPMTAAGMTLGFTDAVSLAEAERFSTWEAERVRNAEAPGLLATALYEIFAVQSPATRACRRAVFDMWADQGLREASMGYLSADDTHRGRFFGLGVQLVARASAHIVAEESRPDRWITALASLRRVAGLVHWLAHESVPPAMRYALVSSATTPFQVLREEHTALLAQRAAGVEA